jgi:hypothetical protein
MNWDGRAGLYCDVSPVLRGLRVFGMDRTGFLTELTENFVGEIGQEEMGKAGAPSLGLGGGDGLAGESRRNALNVIALDEDLLDGEDASGEAAAGIWSREIGIEAGRSGPHELYLTGHLLIVKGKILGGS